MGRARKVIGVTSLSFRCGYAHIDLCVVVARLRQCFTPEGEQREQQTGAEDVGHKTGWIKFIRREW